MMIFWIGIGCFVIIGLFTLFRAKQSVTDPTLNQIADTIDEFLNGSGGPYDWQDFISHQKLKDPKLESIRAECAAIAQKFPPEEPKDWCNELGKNELLKISERLHEEFKQVLAAKKKAAAEAKAKSQPQPCKSPKGLDTQGKGPAILPAKMPTVNTSAAPVVPPAAIGLPATAPTAAQPPVPAAPGAGPQIPPPASSAVATTNLPPLAPLPALAPFPAIPQPATPATPPAATPAPAPIAAPAAPATKPSPATPATPVSTTPAPAAPAPQSAPTTATAPSSPAAQVPLKNAG